MEARPRSFYFLAAFFVLFLIFLYGPTITIAILSFQGPQGGLTFPMRGVSLHWFHELFQQQAVGDIWGSFARSFVLGLMVMVTTVVVSVMGGLAFRKRFPGSAVIFYLIITSLVIPSILISLGVGLIFSQSGLTVHWSTSGFGSQLTWTLPFGLLIMFAVFNRFDKSYEEAARDLGGEPTAGLTSLGQIEARGEALRAEVIFLVHHHAERVLGGEQDSGGTGRTCLHIAQ